MTRDHGASFTWRPITENSTRDNLRPIVPATEPGLFVLLWFRGTYHAAQSFDAAVVGLVERQKGAR